VDADYGIIGNGKQHSITLGSDYSGIFSGESNLIEASYSSIMGGCLNKSNTPFSFVSGGFKNGIHMVAGTLNADGISIGGGQGNFISNSIAANDIQGSGIFGGFSNGICNSQLSFILGGQGNQIQSSFALIAGGLNNRIFSNSNTSGIFSGEDNFIGNIAGTAHSHCSFIGGGWGNGICNDLSAIGSGRFNFICGYTSFIGSGVSNTVRSSRSFIGSGDNNFIDKNAHCSAILGGQNHVINNLGIYSSILGGQGNTINHPYAAVFGNGINTVAANTFHMENIWSQGIGATPVMLLNLPLANPGIPGAVWIDTTTIPGARLLQITP
jgi:hypothetical protein